MIVQADRNTLLDILYLHKKWNYVRVNQSKLKDEPALTAQLQRYLTRKFGANRYTEFRVGHNMDDIVKDKVTISFRLVNPLNN